MASPLSPTSTSALKDSRAAVTQDLLVNVPQDSSPLLVTRYDQWGSVLQKYTNFVTGYHAIATANIKLLEKLNKHLLADTQLPVFDHETQIGSIQAAQRGQDADNKPLVSNATNDGIHGFFETLKRTTSDNLVRAAEYENNLMTQVLPEIKTLMTDLSTKKKQLQTDTTKLAKELQKLVQVSTKEVSRLGEATRTYDAAAGRSPKIDYRTDPYLLQRQLLGAASHQIKQENINTENALLDESKFEVMEKNLIETLKKNVATFSRYTTAYFAESFAGGLASVSAELDQMTNSFEWEKFQAHYRNQLLSNPENANALNNTKKDLDLITFAHRDHLSTQPILEGVLNRKDSNALKSIGKTLYVSAYFVITKSKYLLEYPSNTVDASATPSAAYFLPDCTLAPFVSKKSKPEGNTKFVLEGKDATALLSHKKLMVFKAANEEDQRIWMNVLSEATGLMMQTEELLRGTTPASGSTGTVVSPGGALLT